MANKKVLALTAGILTSSGGVIGCAPPKGAVPLNAEQQVIVDTELARGKVFLPTVVAMTKASNIQFNIAAKDAQNADELALDIQDDFDDVIWLREQDQIMAIDPSYREDASDPELAFYDGAQQAGAHERIKHDYVVIYSDSFDELDMWHIGHEMGHSHGGHGDTYIEKRDSDAGEVQMLKASRVDRDPAGISGTLWDETLGLFDNAMTAMSPIYNETFYSASTEEEYRSDVEVAIERLLAMDPEAFWDTAFVPAGRYAARDELESDIMTVDFVEDPMYNNLGWRRTETLNIFAANPELQVEAMKYIRETVEKQIEIRYEIYGDWESGIQETAEEENEGNEVSNERRQRTQQLR